MLRHPAPGMIANIAKFANFDSFKSFTECYEDHTEARRPFRFVGWTLPVSGQDDAVRGSPAPGRIPGGEELARDLRSHEPEPLAGMRDLTRL